MEVEDNTLDDNVEIEESPFIVKCNSYEADADEIKRMYGTRERLLAGIIKLYKKIIKDRVYIFDTLKIGNNCKTKQNNSMKFEFDKVMNDSKDHLKRVLETHDLWIKQTEIIPHFIDFCFIYYLHTYDTRVPLYELPKSLMRYNLITGFNDYKQHKKLNNIFIEIINNEFITDLRTFPPYNMRRSEEQSVVEKKIDEIKPLLKGLLEHILNLPSECMENKGSNDDEVDDEVDDEYSDNNNSVDDGANNA